MDPPRYRDSNQVKRKHGHGVDAHRPRIGAGADDRSDDEDGEEESSRQGVVGTTSAIVANNTTPTKRK